MELRVLRYFLMVAREENITRAAECLHITQPTLSRQLADLEAELGVILFERGRHKISLTQDGLLLKSTAQEIVELEEKVKNQFLENDESVSGEISFGCGELLSTTELSRWLVSFCSKYPKVRYKFFTGTADDIKDRVEKGLLDFALLMEPVDIAKYEFVRMKTMEKWCLLVKEDSYLSKKKYISPKDLKNMPLILPSRENVQNILSNWLGEYSKKLNIVSTVNLPYNGSILVQQGLGVYFTLSLDCHYGGVLAKQLKPPVESSSVLAWKRGFPHSKIIETFITHLRASLLIV